MAAEEIKAIKRPGRWDVPYADELVGAEMSYEVVRELLRGSLKQLARDRKRFPSDLELSGLLRHDTRVRHFKKGELIVREGEYGNSAFFILEGGVNVVLSRLPSHSLGNRRSELFPKLFNSVARAIRRTLPYPETRHGKSKQGSEPNHRQVIPLQDFSEFLVHGSDSEFDSNSIQTLSASDSQVGEIFGELAAFSRSPRTASVLAASDDTQLLEIRWQGLRDIRKFSPSWKEMIDHRYRTSSLGIQLAHIDYLKNLSSKPSEKGEPSEVNQVSEQTQFRSFGEYSWKASFKEMAAGGVQNLGKNEPTILSQGSIVGDLVIIRNGFVRVSRKYNHGEKTVTYLGKGQIYGMLEIFHNSTLSREEYSDKQLTYQHTLSAVGYVDLLVIPAHVIESLVIPKLTSPELTSLETQLDQLNSEDNYEVKRDGKMMEFLLQQRAINGTASMFIDLDRCTHCDDCVRACASTHDNNPRFIRHGPSQDGIQLTHACMHCVDPVCMIGCPTGAIQRDAVGNQVIINENTCIGCATCADNCPYDNIQMVELRDENGDFQPGTREDKTLGITRLSPAEDPLRKATKCDLCETLVTGPACVNACPHDALIRIDMTEPKTLFNWIDRK